MAFGIYVHIPFCIQRCKYCDFTTFKLEDSLSTEEYVSYVHKELSERAPFFGEKSLESIYFGGGTPSLLPAKDIVSIIEKIASSGFTINKETEITIEINPATIDEEKMKLYLSAGVNRFSVGAQSFDDELLKLCGREHNSQDTVRTLELLKSYDINYSFDLLFALPKQSLEQLSIDLDRVIDFDPPHLSAYCLTVPPNHEMARNRPQENVQIEMFKKIEEKLETIGMYKYEISNFAKPGYESKHNMLYWTDNSYWGIGLSSHSYLASEGQGLRFWNPKSFKEYYRQIEGPQEELSFPFIPQEQQELLKTHEAMTDFCHIYLRTTTGLPKDALQKFTEKQSKLIIRRLESLKRRDLLKETDEHWQMTPEAMLMSNKIYNELTFLPDEI